MEFRAVYPLARLTAQVGNSGGGIPKKKGAKVSDADPYEWEWFVPNWAHYAPLLELYGEPDPLAKVDPAALKELWEGRGDLGTVHFMSVDWRAVCAALGIDPKTL